MFPVSCKFLVDELTGFSKLVTGKITNMSISDWSSLVLPFTQTLFLKNTSLLPSFESVCSNTEIFLRSYRDSWSMQFGSEDGFC